MEPERRISRKHGRQTGTARCDRCPGRGVCLSIHLVQKTSPHFQQWYCDAMKNVTVHPQHIENICILQCNSIL